MLNHSFDSETEVIEFSERYLESLPALAAEFDAVAASAGVLVDSSPQSLIATNRYFLNQLVGVDLRPTDELPMWWDTEVMTKEEQPDFWFTRPQLHWVDVYQAHVALLMASQPNARWSIYRGRRKEVKNGTPILVVDWHPGFDIRNYVYGEALRKIRGRSPVSDSDLFDYFFGTAATNHVTVSFQ